MKTELFIENNRADLTAELSALLTFQINDIKNFSSKETNFSKTIVLPGTARNNKLLGQVYELGSSNTYDTNLPNINVNFNPAKSASAYLFTENLQVFKGIIRLLKVIRFKGTVEYEIALFGELGGFVTKMGNGKLEDLDFSSYDLDYTIANIETSWDNPGGSGVYFPLIDYGSYSTDKHDWKYRTFRPALYVKEYLDKIFTAAGYTYDCALFNTTRFESFVVPQNTKELVKATEIALDVSQSTTTTFTHADGHNNLLPVPLATQLTLGNFTVNGANTEFTYTPSTSLTGTIKADLTGTYTKVDAPVNFSIGIYVNGSPSVLGTFMLFGGGNVGGSYDSANSLFGSLTGTITLNQNDVVTIYVSYLSATGNYSVSVSAAHLTFDTGAAGFVPIALGETIPINDSIPKNILQKDFFSSIVKLFNLYVYEDKDVPNKLIITPYIDFFDLDPSTAEDWSYKVDRNKAMEIKPMGELNSKYYHFVYKKDSDYYNDLYTKRYNENYGDRIYNSDYEFSNDVSKSEIIFSGTPLVGYTGEDKIYSTIFKKSGTTEETTDSNIRILQAKKVTGVTSWDILDDDGTTVLDSFTTYGYAGHLNDPDAPSNDLNFGVPKELFFTLVSGNLSNNQFNLYHSAYLAEITSKDSKLLTCTCYLTTKDIYNLDFSKLKFIDGNLFRLNLIDNFDALNPDTCKVELLKVIELVY